MVRRVPSSRACGARPSSEWPSDVKKALQGKPRDGAKGGFLGGTRSPRPHCKAVRKPGEVMITDGRAKGWWPNGAIFRRKERPASGRAEPAPPRGAYPS